MRTGSSQAICVGGRQTGHLPHTGKVPGDISPCSHQQREVLGTVQNKSSLLDSNLKIMRKFSERDSILLDKKVISPAEFERNQLNYLNSMGSMENTRGEQGTVRLELQKTVSVHYRK